MAKRKFYSVAQNQSCCSIRWSHFIVTRTKKYQEFIDCLSRIERNRYEVTQTFHFQTLSEIMLIHKVLCKKKLCIVMYS
jgi:hypothetical protein